MSSTLRSLSRMWHRLCALLLLGALGPPINSYAANADESLESLKNMAWEDLVNLEVSIASGAPRLVADTAAAVTVITEDDIHRSGATTVAEILRLVPGFNVARIDANSWAISSRGFNGQLLTKLLVLIDGRSIYNPVFPGTNWDMVDTLIEDIDHIEIIRGPGASTWGANAVNGVVNIITKDAQHTQGVMLSAGAGSEEKLFGSVRYGTQLGDDIYYRVFLKSFDRDDSELTNDQPAADHWHAWRGGFRVDWPATPQDSFSLQGEYYSSKARQILLLPYLEEPLYPTL